MFTIYFIEILTTLCWVLFFGIVGTIIGLCVFLYEQDEGLEDAKDMIKRCENENIRLGQNEHPEKYEWNINKNNEIIAERKEEIKKYKNIIKRFIFSLIILVTLFVVTPSTRTAYRIWGIGSVVEYVRENPTAKGLPDKVIERLDKWLDKEDLIKNDDNEKQESKNADEELNKIVDKIKY